MVSRDGRWKSDAENHGTPELIDRMELLYMTEQHPPDCCGAYGSSRLSTWTSRIKGQCSSNKDAGFCNGRAHRYCELDQDV